MALTRDFRETVVARVQRDQVFAQALLDEAITLFVNGEPDTAKLILRDLVNATVGFESLAEEIHKPAGRGNPQAGQEPASDAFGLGQPNDDQHLGDLRGHQAGAEGGGSHHRGHGVSWEK